MQQQLARLTAEDIVDQNRGFARVPIMGAVRRELEVPFAATGGGIEREYRIRVEAIALSSDSVIVWRRVPGAPEDGVGFRILSACHPCRPAAELGGVARPRRTRRIARLSDRLDRILGGAFPLPPGSR